MKFLIEVTQKNSYVFHASAGCRESKLFTGARPSAFKKATLVPLCWVHYSAGKNPRKEGKTVLTKICRLSQKATRELSILTSGGIGPEAAKAEKNVFLL